MNAAKFGAALFVTAAGWAGTVYTPNIDQNAEAPGAINLLAGSSVGQKQMWIISSSQFSALSGNTLITEFDMRPNCDDPSCSFPGSAFGPTTIHGLQITLGITTLPPGNVSSDNTFADYLTNSAMVFSGDLTVSSSDSGPALGPKVFDVRFPFTSSFNYNPAQGNLVVQFAVSTPDGIPTFVDGLQDGTGAFGRIFSGFSNTTGLGDTFNPVLRFTTQAPVSGAPEPGTWIVILGLAAAWRARGVARAGK